MIGAIDLAASSASAIDRRKWSIRAERASLRELSSFEYNHQSEEGGGKYFFKLENYPPNLED